MFSQCLELFYNFVVFLADVDKHVSEFHENILRMCVLTWYILVLRYTELLSDTTLVDY